MWWIIIFTLCSIVGIRAASLNAFALPVVGALKSCLPWGRLGGMASAAAAQPTNAGEGMAEGAGEAEEGESKKARKRRERNALFTERKMLKRERERDKRRARAEEERQRISKMDPAERAALEAQREAEKVAYFAARDAFNDEREAAVKEKGMVRVAIDLGYPNMMTDSETSSLASQIANAHGANIKVVLPKNRPRSLIPAELLPPGEGGLKEIGEVLPES